MDEDVGVDWEGVAWQLLSGLRAGRSQREFSRLLGYRSNVACNWEARRRFPTAERTLAICTKLGIRATEALAGFVPPGSDVTHVGRWLDVLRGETSLADLSRRSGFSRHALARWLSGRAQPRLPDFLKLVHAINGRVVDLVKALSLLGSIPELTALDRQLATRRQAEASQSERRCRLMRLRAELGLRRLQQARPQDWFDSTSVSGAAIERVRAILSEAWAKVREVARVARTTPLDQRRLVVNLQLVDWPALG